MGDCGSQATMLERGPAGETADLQLPHSHMQLPLSWALRLQAQARPQARHVQFPRQARLPGLPAGGLVPKPMDTQGPTSASSCD